MPAANTSKVKCSYHTDDSHEEHIQAARLDFEQRKISIRAAARLHQVRPDCIYHKLTSSKSLGSLWNIVGPPAWTCLQGGQYELANPFSITRSNTGGLD
jgi:hypothetical protein